MRIAICHHFDLDFYSGGEKFVIQMSNELTKLGHTVSVYTTPFIIEGRKALLNAHKLLLDEVHFEKGWHHTPQADIVYVMYDPYTPINKTIFDLSKCQSKITGVHSSSFWEPVTLMYGKVPNVGRIAQFFFGNYELSRYDAVHTLTNAFKLNHPNIYVIPNYVDSSIYKITDKKSKFTVAFTSRHSNAKGYDVFQEVTKNLDVDVAVSSGNMAETDLIDLVATSHLSFLPSKVDTFGYSIVESIMSGTPVLTTLLEAHKQLKLPLMYSNSNRNFGKSINVFKRIFEETKQEYDTWCLIGRQAAKRFYDKQVVLEQFENMLLEVHKRKCYAS